MNSPQFLNDAMFDLVVGGDECGLLIDRKSGQILTLNKSATAIWRHRLEGADTETLVSWILKQVEMPIDDARKLVEDTLSPIAMSEPNVHTEYRYDTDGDGYRMSTDGRDRLWYSNDGERIRWIDPERSPERIGDCLWTALPRLLFLKGQYLLHGSAISDRGHATLFIGANGAGKSSTARAFVSETAAVCGDDKLAIGVDANAGTVAPGAESFFRQWVSAARAELLGSASSTKGPERYDGSGSELLVTRIFFLSPEQREQSAVLRFEPMAATEASGMLFRQFFFGNDARAQWQFPLRWSSHVANHALCARLFVPNDLQALKRAAENLFRA